jgi:hypothetical protein
MSRCSSGLRLLSFLSARGLARPTGSATIAGGEHHNRAAAFACGSCRRDRVSIGALHMAKQSFGKHACGALFVVALALQAPLHAAEPFEGLWAKTQKECLDEEGPNSRTLIDLGNLIEGKPSPLFDQYENHCKVERKAVAGDGTTTLTATCFEFWEDFTKGIEGQQATIKLSPGPKGTLKINGTSYRRCEEKNPARSK